VLRGARAVLVADTQQGGGTAGLAVAARLSENPDITVAVLEAGQWRPDCPLVSGIAAASRLR
jgi:choline dehydrogenase-like flavoprotein